MKTNTSGRNINIDILRFFAALVVVVIHVYNNTKGAEALSPYLLSITSWGVPYFFIVSGFLAGARRDGFHLLGVLNIVLRLVSIYLVGIFFYFATDFGTFKENGLIFSLKYLISGQPNARHLWFLLSMIFGYGALYVLFMATNRIFIGSVSVILVIIGLMINPYPVLYDAMNSTGQRILMLLYPHFLSIPLIFFGFLVGESRIQDHLRPLFMAIFSIASLVLTVLEGVYAYSYGATSQFYTWTYFFSAGTFLLAITAEPPSGKIFKLLALVGERYSLIIYIYHLFILNSFGLLVLKNAEINPVITIFANSILLYIGLAAVFFALDRINRRIVRILDGSAMFYVLEGTMERLTKRIVRE